MGKRNLTETQLLNEINIVNQGTEKNLKYLKLFFKRMLPFFFTQTQNKLHQNNENNMLHCSGSRFSVSFTSGLYVVLVVGRDEYQNSAQNWYRYWLIWYYRYRVTTQIKMLHFGALFRTCQWLCCTTLANYFTFPAMWAGSYKNGCGCVGGWSLSQKAKGEVR